MTTQIAATFRPTAEPEPYIGYIRVSTWREEKISPEIQRHAIEEWARRTGKHIVDWVPDLDASGRNFHRKIMRAIELVEAGKARGIAVWRYSRFGRDRVGNAVNLARVENVGGRLESATEPIDAATAIGRFQRGMMLEFAAFESDRIGEQWKEIHAHRLGLLLPSGGRKRFGYAWYPRRVPDPNEPTGYRLQAERYEPRAEEAAALAYCYHSYINGTGFVDLARYLNEQGFRTTRGRAWKQDTLLRFMDSGFAAGYLQVRDSCDCPKSRASSCRHWRRFRGAHDAVVNFDLPNRDDSEEMWEEYRERRQSKAKMPPRARSASYDTTGLVRCIWCRGAMSGRPKPGAVYWRCAKADGGGDCEGVTATHSDLLAEVRRFLVKVANGVDEAPATPIVAPPQTEGAGPVEDRAALTIELTKLDGALTRLVTDFAMNPGRYPAQAYDAARHNLERDRNAVAEKLDKIREKEEEVKPKLDDFRPLVVGLLPEWDSFTTVEHNLFLRKLIRHILVSPRPSRFETRARIVPVWEDEATMWDADSKGKTGVAVPRVPSEHEPCAHIEDMLDGIAWSVA
ncbi:recombinase family protein [Streptomyces phaeochromogenes]|uniref:recombinase family protein n=1 Tax=Streptomyces phaeochromogenes TaxID=1923 RepID=UPI002DDA35FB|nr:recombinase family protein [Streptomyces phaeochromogenes]WRZ29961.1 recombinase family protein [Streptomyces phaeochromogenes]